MIHFVDQIFEHLGTWGLPTLVLILGVIEFAFGLYGKHWNRNEMLLDITCFTVPKLVIRPLVAYFGLKFLPYLLPDAKNAFDWVPFWWGFAIIAVADDLTQYWYHRLHHEVPFLWRFHRTHHSAPYMGMAMASRYTLFFANLPDHRAGVRGTGVPNAVCQRHQVDHHDAGAFEHSLG